MRYLGWDAAKPSRTFGKPAKFGGWPWFLFCSRLPGSDLFKPLALIIRVLHNENDTVLGVQSVMTEDLCTLVTKTTVLEYVFFLK
jgi:hypothetical protein